MCFNFLTGRTGPSTGPQSSADIAAGGYVPPGNRNTSTQINAGNPQSDTATPQGQRAAVQSQQTTDRNTIRRADSYGSQLSSAKQTKAKVVKNDKTKKTYNAAAVQGGQTIMSALNTYNNTKKTILGG